MEINLTENMLQTSSMDDGVVIACVLPSVSVGLDLTSV
jgi:hypothetical protein